MIPDWQLPDGVDRGLHDYLNSAEMVGGYDAIMANSPLAQFDVQYCETWFPSPGSLVDLGCGTGRLGRYFTGKGFKVLGVDLSEEMLKAARAAGNAGEFLHRSLLDESLWPGEPFDYAACLFSTLGMVIGAENRLKVLKNAFVKLNPGGVFVLHVHNRHFTGLGIRGWFNGDLQMPQAYGGAPLTLHHYSRGEALRMMKEVGFQILDVQAVGLNGPLNPKWLFPTLRAYGYLIAAKKPHSVALGLGGE